MLIFLILATTTTTTTTPPTTTSTSTTSSTTSTTTTTTAIPTTSTSSTTTTTTTKNPKARARRDAVPNFEWNIQHLVKTGSIRPESIANENMTYFLTTTEMSMEDKIKLLENETVPYFGICTNDTKIISDPKKIYGYYQRNVVVENPIKDVVVGNNVWLKHGDMCHLSMKFDGTAPFHYCMAIKVTNDSSVAMAQNDEQDCDKWDDTDDKEIKYSHFFAKNSNSYTVTFYLKNEVSLVKTPIGVKFYEGKF